jgi:hydrogenase maturation protease
LLDSAPAETTSAAAVSVVLGVGNLLRADDGVGVHAVQALMRRGGIEGVQVLDGGTAPLDALAGIGPIDRLIIVDAADLGEAPGSVRVLSPDDLIPACGDSVSLHDLDLLWALGVMRAIGNEPPEVLIVGVQPASMDWSTELSPAVAARLDDIMEAVLAAIPARPSGREKVRE